MVKSSELRIGNKVYFNGQIITVQQILSDSIIAYKEADCADDEYSFTEIEPIHLTPEILEKAGWVWNEECNSFEKYPNGDARMNLEYREINNSYTMFNYILKSLICKKIYYLHQLQNIYYAIMGEELEINLTNIPEPKK